MTGTQERGLTVRADTRMETMADPAERERLLRNLIMPKASPEQLDLVLAICQRYRLDPLLRHVLIVSGNLYVTRDGLRHLAWQTGEFDGYDPPEERQDDKGKWIVTARVYRKGIARPFTATAYQSEAENTSSPVWRSHPRLMTGKVAEVIALRMAFGVSLSGAEEIGFDDSNQTKFGEARFVEAAPAQVAVPREKAAPPPLPATPLPAEEFVAFVDGFLALAEEGHSNGALIGAMAAKAAELDQAQRDELKAHFGAIIEERKVTRGQAVATPPAIIEVQVVANPVDAGLGWTEAWSWFRANGFHDRKALDAFLGKSTQGMTPGEIKVAVEAQMPDAAEVAAWDAAARDDSQGPPTAAALAASDDPFGDGQPASHAG